MRINSFVPSGELSADLIALSPDESHHLARVLRVEAGQELTLFDGCGTRAEGVVDSVSKKEVVVRVLQRNQIPKPAVDITLIQALPKPDRFEVVLQKATELGVRQIQPVLSRHTINRSKEADKQHERWNTIVRNAAQQCNTAWLPEIKPLAPLAAVFSTLGQQDLVLIGSLHPNARPLRQVFQELDRSTIKTAALLIGPEGDFTEEEVESAVAAGAVPVTFGSQILRTETAAIFGLSILTYEMF